MTYSSIRWGYTLWWLATVVCFLDGLAFLADLIAVVRNELIRRNACHGTDDVRRHLPASNFQERQTHLNNDL
ncbi:hypothetical protein KIN20_029091 [Parelaphostrongylus tenuis]|uniref:Uncharacterized protein n=1 Tax=Parelaphostrongylus tenuis TaxID=148309 RepID=A0AAD5R1Z2_PARTN|nr:hypothetical protein KIN20_029091 [Parelaphostrongylus tenuis]